MEGERIKVMLIDHQQLFREGIRKILQAESSIYMITSGDDFLKKVHLLESYDADILLISLEIFMKHEDLIKELIEKHESKLKVVIMATLNDKNHARKAVELGVRGYLLKEMEIKTFIQAIHAIYDGLLYIHPIINDSLLNYFIDCSRGKPIQKERVTIKPPAGFYTKREYEVLQLLAKGYSNREIAKHLEISDKTVKNHISSIFKKMNVNDRTRAVITAVKNQWISI